MVDSGNNIGTSINKRTIQKNATLKNLTICKAEQRKTHNACEGKVAM